MSLGIHSEVDEQRSEVGLFLEITLVILRSTYFCLKESF